MFSTPKQTGRASLFTRTSASAVAQGRRRLQVAPRTTPSVASRSAKAEQVLEETGQHVVKALNSPVPVQVQEALRGDLRAASILLHESGWAWLVAGSKLLLWKFSTPHLSVQCRQLTLPSSSAVVRWNAELVTVLSGANDSHVAVMAVSPEGAVCYWSDALRDNPSLIQGSVDVGEGYSLMLVGLPGLPASLLTTTQASLFLIQPPSQTQGELSIRQLHVPRGVLSGFSRRVSSLFFGSQSDERQEARRVVATPSSSEGSSVAFVLTSTSLQKWSIELSLEQMAYDAPLENMMKEAVIHEGWFSDPESSSGSILVTMAPLSLWIIDMQVVSQYVAILFAVTGEGSTTAEYGLALIQADSDVTPLTVDHLIRLNHRIPYRAGDEGSLRSLCLHGCGTFSSTTVAYNRNKALLTDVKRRTAAGCADIINFPPPNSIIGTGSHGGSLLFFTLNQGVIAMALHSHAHPSTTRLSSSFLATPSLPSFQGLPPLVSSSLEPAVDKTEVLHNAFMDYLDSRKDTVEVAIQCEEHFPLESFAPRLDTPCDLAVLRLSELVLNELPTSDPRRGDTISRDSSSGGSLIVIYQLEDKLFAHNRFVQFVTDIGLLDKLTSVLVRGHAMLTRHLLCEHAEKLTAAITLRKMHNHAVDQAISLALKHSSSSPRSGLTPQDIFYSQVSSIDAIFPAFLEYQESSFSSLPSPQERTQLVISVAAVMEAMLREAVQYRQSKSALYQSSTVETSEPEFLPWTGSSGVRNCISQQLQTMLDVCIKDAAATQDEQQLWVLIVKLCDILFDGYLTQLASIEKNPALSGKLDEVRITFESERRQFLMPMLDHGQYRHAAELGERYRDFRVLVQLCERLNSKEQLREYMARFSSQGFSDFLFKQYLDQGKLQQLLSYSEAFPSELGQFLEPHDSLSWMHHLTVHNYSKAHQTLRRLAEKEERYVAKKKTLLSLSKLAVLASDCPEGEKSQEVGALNSQLQLIDFQQSIPLATLENCGMENTSMPPLPPREVIELYVGERNPDTNVLHFLCALEFLEFAFPDSESSPEAQELRVYIWSQAILKNDWSQLSTDNPLGQLQMTFFFQLCEEAHNKGMNLLALLPDVEALLDSGLLADVGLTRDPDFQFLMRAGYEQIGRVQNTLESSLLGAHES